MTSTAVELPVSESDLGTLSDPRQHAEQINVQNLQKGDTAAVRRKTVAAPGRNGISQAFVARAVGARGRTRRIIFCPVGQHRQLFHQLHKPPPPLPQLQK